jgi:hypothetical protein
MMLFFFVLPIKRRNRKDELFNHITEFFKCSSAGFHESEVVLGRKFLTLLRDVFWHIDGHHHIFEERAHKNPSIFHSFAGFNVPERSKHRKRITSNINNIRRSVKRICA